MTAKNTIKPKIGSLYSMKKKSKVILIYHEFVWIIILYDKFEINLEQI